MEGGSPSIIKVTWVTNTFLNAGAVYGESEKEEEEEERERGFEVIDIRPSFRSCMEKHASLFSPLFRNGKL